SPPRPPRRGSPLRAPPAAADPQAQPARSPPPTTTRAAPSPALPVNLTGKTTSAHANLLVLRLALNYIGVNPIQALVYTAVINGVVAAPLLFLVARIAERRDIMGDAASGWLSRTLVWL